MKQVYIHLFMYFILHEHNFYLCASINLGIWSPCNGPSPWRKKKEQYEYTCTCKNINIKYMCGNKIFAWKEKKYLLSYLCTVFCNYLFPVDWLRESIQWSSFSHGQLHHTICQIIHETQFGHYFIVVILQHHKKV